MPRVIRQREPEFLAEQRQHTDAILKLREILVVFAVRQRASALRYSSSPHHTRRVPCFSRHSAANGSTISRIFPAPFWVVASSGYNPSRCRVLPNGTTEMLFTAGNNASRSRRERRSSSPSLMPSHTTSWQFIVIPASAKRGAARLSASPARLFFSIFTRSSGLVVCGRNV